MDEFWLTFLSMPPFAVYGVVGGVVGGLATIVAHFAASGMGFTKKKATLVSAISLIMSIQLANQVISPWFLEESRPAETVNELKKSRLFADIFRYHPEAEQELLNRYRQVYSAPPTEIQRLSQSLTQEIVARYVNRHMLMASGAAIHNLMKSEAVILVALQSRPEDCVNFYLGRPITEATTIPGTLVANILNAKAQVIESAVNAPAPPLTNIGTESSAVALLERYRQSGFDIRELEKIDSVPSLPPTDGCRIALHFSSALVSLGEKQGAAVYKALLIAAREAQSSAVSKAGSWP